MLHFWSQAAPPTPASMARGVGLVNRASGTAPGGVFLRVMTAAWALDYGLLPRVGWHSASRSRPQLAGYSIDATNQAVAPIVCGCRVGKADE